jgi:hypothetical protein
LYGYAPDQQLPGMMGSSMGGTDYSAYQPWADNGYGYGKATGSGYNAATQAAVDARPVVQHNNAANAPAFQPQNPNDPYYQRSDIQPFIQATNRDVMGGGQYGVRNWVRDHPVGTIIAGTALTAGGALAAGGWMGAGVGGAAAPAAGGAAAPGSSSGLGYFANGGVGGIGTLGSGNAGVLAATPGAIQGGSGLVGLGSTGLGGFLGSHAGSLNSLLGGGQQQGAQGGGQAMPSININQPQQQQAAQRPQQAILPGMQQSPIQGFTRRPYQFNGATIWM